MQRLVLNLWENRIGTYGAAALSDRSLGVPAQELTLNLGRNNLPAGHTSDFEGFELAVVMGNTEDNLLSAQNRILGNC